jgi:hypothetical protein
LGEDGQRIIEKFCAWSPCVTAFVKKLFFSDTFMYYTRVIRIDPNDASAKENLDIAERQRG